MLLSLKCSIIATFKLILKFKIFLSGGIAKKL